MSIYHNGKFYSPVLYTNHEIKKEYGKDEYANYQVIDGCAYKISSDVKKALSFDSIKRIEDPVFAYKFCYDSSISSLSFPNLSSMSDYSMLYMCQNANDLEEVNLSTLKVIPVNSMYYAFSNCGKLKYANFENVKEMSISNYTSQYMFSGCSNLVSVNFQNLQIINFGTSMFNGCSMLSNIYFPNSLSICKAYSNTFSNCNNLTAIHFNKESENSITAAQYYSSKWGANKATIYFDL